MNRSKNVFVMLANQAETGDPSAKGELRRELEPAMVHIVRRVLRAPCKSGRSSMDRRILTEARRLGLNADLMASPDGELLIRQVAQVVSDLVVDAPRVRPAQMHDTVCN